jgi:hypothetical protein
VPDSITRFFVLGDARTGSNMLTQALNTNPAIRCFRKVFHFMHDYVDYGIDGFDPNVPADVEFRNNDPVRFLNERLYAGAPPGVQAVGFKYLYGHFWGFDALTDYLSEEHEIRVIHLTRRNMLRSLVSLHIAESSGRWLEDWGVAPRPSTWMTKAQLRRLPSDPHRQQAP